MQVLKTLLECVMLTPPQLRRYVTPVGLLIAVEPLTITSNLFTTLKNYINKPQLLNYVQIKEITNGDMG